MDASIVQFEQDAADRAQYGSKLIASLADDLKAQGHPGLGARNLKNYMQSALTWPHFSIRQTVSADWGLSLSP